MNKFEYLIAESRSQFSFGKLLSVGMKNVSITNTGAPASCRCRFASCSAHTVVRAATASKSASAKGVFAKHRECTSFYGDN